MSKAAKILLAVLIGFGAGTFAAQAAQRQMMAQADMSPQDRDRLLRSRNIAPTGETLPHPGSSQIGDETAQEKSVQRRSDRDTHSICSNCE
jgi:hypothetical protein